MSRKFIIDMSWAVLLKDLKLDAADLLRRAQLPEDLFTQKQPTLNTEQYFRLWDSIADSGKSDDWLINVIQTATPETFSPPLFAALCSPNLWTALQRLSEFKLLIGPMRLQLQATHEGLCATLEVIDTTLEMPPAFTEMELVFLVNLARTATRERIVPLEVVSTTMLSRAYYDYFGVTPRMGDRVSLHFANADLGRPFLTSKPAMWEFFEPQLRLRLQDLQSDSKTSQRVYSVLLELLPAGKSSVEDVAGKLAMSKRTLQRKLQAEETSFQSVLQAVRIRLAKHYLQHERISGIEIALLLGFDSHSAFIRAFNQWTGLSPVEYLSANQRPRPQR